MYQFKIKKQENGGYRFELGGIKILVSSYAVKDGMHVIEKPDTAIAYFNIGDNIYGVSNDPWNYNSAEAFYDAIKKQYLMLNNDHEIDLKPSKLEPGQFNNHGNLRSA